MKKPTKLPTFLSALLIFASTFTACEKIDLLGIDTVAIYAYAEGGTFQITVNSNGAWTAVVQDAENNSWITLDNASGTYSGVITVNIEKNTDFEARNIAIVVSMRTWVEVVPVNQEATKPLLNIDTETIIAPAEGGTFLTAVSSNGEWTAIVQDAENNLWITLDNASGVNNGVITVNVAENTISEIRNAKIKVSMGSLKEYVLVEQEGAEELEPFLEIDKTTITATANGLP